MGVPTHIFIDTCIFERAGFNFESMKLKPFREAMNKLELTFLDPDPIFRERNRHLRNRVDEAVRSLERIEKSLPVITSLSKWPKASFIRENEIRRLINNSLSDFLKPMNQIKLGYDGVDMHRIMTWYEQGRAPFGPGKKSKEFPDALAVAILDRYAQLHKCEVAIVSSDTDFERACAERVSLLFFPSLSAYLQILQGESERVSIVQKWFEENPEAFDESVGDAFSDIGFEIEEGWDGELTDPELDTFDVSEFYVIAVADKECTVSFEAEIGFSIRANYEDENEYDYDPDGVPYGHPRKEEIKYASAYSTVLAKIKLNDSAAKVVEVTYLDLDISSVSVSVASTW